MNLNQLKNGVIGVTKATLGIDKVTDQVYANRLNTCGNCIHCLKTNEKIRCMKCGCNIKKKAKISSEKCPYDKWDKI